MARIRGGGFNKEKFFCLLAVLSLFMLTLVLFLAREYPTGLILQGYVGLFGSSPPEHLQKQPPVTTMHAPSAYQQQAMPSPPSMAGNRKTPFAPTQYQVGPPQVPTKSVAVAPPPPLPPQSASVAPTDPKSVKDKELDVSYMGVMQVQGETYGLLRAKDGSYRRVKEGEKMPDFNCTVKRIEKQAIFVETDEGRVYTLRSDRFAEVAGSGGSASTKDNLPSFAEPKKSVLPGTDKVQPPRPQREPKGTAPGQRPARPQPRPQPRTQG
jgi:hypothetical protein